LNGRGVCDLETGGARASRGIKVLGGLGIVETRTSQESSTDETESRILMLLGKKTVVSSLYFTTDKPQSGGEMKVVPGYQ
jgi:hypothetical protein